MSKLLAITLLVALLGFTSARDNDLYFFVLSDSDDGSSSRFLEFGEDGSGSVEGSDSMSDDGTVSATNSAVASFSNSISDSALNNDFSPLSDASWASGTGYDPSGFDTDTIASNTDFSGLDSSSITSNVGDFVSGFGYGIAEDQIDGINTAMELPSDVQNTMSAWGNVDWTDGSSIQSALGSTAQTLSDSWSAANGITGGALSSATEGAITEFATDVNPIAGLVVGAGFASYNIAENSVDISNKISNLATGLENGDWSQAGEAFGGIVRDAIEVRNTAKEQADAGSD